MVRFILCVIGLALFACKKPSACFSKAKQTGEKNIDVPLIDSLVINGALDVELIFDSTLTQAWGTLSGPSNWLDAVEVENVHKHLELTNTLGCKWASPKRSQLQVSIHLPRLHYLQVWGGTHVVAQGTNAVDRFEFSQWESSGTTALNLHAHEVHVAMHTGPGDVAFSGVTGKLFLYSSSEGHVMADALESNYCFLYSDGIGDISVRVHDLVEGKMEGTSDVFLYGNAQNRIIVNGKGRVVVSE